MGANIQQVQKLNRAKVLDYIRKNPNTSRVTIAKETGLSMASLTNITSYLLKKKLIRECGTEDVTRVGRKSSLLRFYHEAHSLICVHISGNNVDVSYTDLAGNIINRYTIGFDSANPTTLISSVIENVLALINQYGKNRILAVSVNISGIVLSNNHLVFSSSLRLKDTSLITDLERETALPVFLYNVTHSRATWCFSCNNQPVMDNMMFVDMRDGIGACQYYLGSINNATLGEIGHTTVERNGEPCFCGNRGCLEAMCSRKRIVKLYKELSGVSLSFEDIAKRYSNGDSHARQIVDECSQYLGIALANLINLFKPSIITINLGDFEGFSAIVEKACDEMHRRAYPSLTKGLIVQKINVGVADTIKGNAYTACDRLFNADFENCVIE